jgi:hypothetical protein
MKPRKFHQSPEEAPLYHCSRCDKYKPESDFYPSSIKRFLSYCKECKAILAKEQKIKHADNVRGISNNLYHNELVRHGRYGDAQTPRPLALVREVLAAWGHKSAISGASENLRVRRLFPDLPLSAENAVPVTAGESQRLTRARTVEAILALFPEDVQARLTAIRATLAAAAAPV